jgi:hypothetical protein
MIVELNGNTIACECNRTGAEDRSISDIKPGAPMARKMLIDYTGSN